VCVVTDRLGQSVSHCVSLVKIVYASYFCFRMQIVLVLTKIKVLPWCRVYSVLQNVIFKFQAFGSEGCGRKRAFTGDTEEYHDALRLDPSVLDEFLARNGLECCRNGVGPYFVSLFPFPCISPISYYKYRTVRLCLSKLA
jgi:hypothetical protein